MNLISKDLMIGSIPSILWGEASDKLFIAVHGNMSRKDDDVIALFAEEAAGKGYRVLSFDLPEHGERAEENYPCMVWNCVSDLTSVMSYARTLSDKISLFACSMGAYFSLLAYKDLPLEQAFFLSPVVSMERVILNMMTWAGINEERLNTEKEIKTPAGQTLYWDYYSYVRSNPVEHWDVPTSILYGSADSIIGYDVISEFVRRFNCRLQVLEHGEHFFHTEEQMSCFRGWLKERITG